MKRHDRWTLALGAACGITLYAALSGLIRQSPPDHFLAQVAHLSIWLILARTR